jgi:hypothetical protein
MSDQTEFFAGDWVEVKSKAEILETLDSKGQLEGMPFMPQMFSFCGKRFQVFARAHKTCDTVKEFKGRRLNATVHLAGLRCDGKAYGGCQAGCVLFWKNVWLRKVGSVQTSGEDLSIKSNEVPSTDEKVWKGTRADGDLDSKDPVYICQATQVPAATMPLPWWEIRQYYEDLVSKNIGLSRLLSGSLYMAYRGLINLGIGWGPLLRWLYDAFQRLVGGVPYPRRNGIIPLGQPTPSIDLNLKPGEWVRVKPYKEILATLDVNNKNRGLFFDAELVPYCGHTFQVLERVHTIINEQTGKMLSFKTPCIILDNVVCQSRYAECRLFCPRRVYIYWREVWLERVESPALRGSSTTASKTEDDECVTVGKS